MALEAAFSTEQLAYPILRSTKLRWILSRCVGGYPCRRGSAREIEIFAIGHFASFSTQSADSGRSLAALVGPRIRVKPTSAGRRSPEATVIW